MLLAHSSDGQILLEVCLGQALSSAIKSAVKILHLIEERKNSFLAASIVFLFICTSMRRPGAMMSLIFMTFLSHIRPENCRIIWLRQEPLTRAGNYLMLYGRQKPMDKCSGEIDSLIL